MSLEVLAIQVNCFDVRAELAGRVMEQKSFSAATPRENDVVLTSACILKRVPNIDIGNSFAATTLDPKAFGY
jgi:hypothetical protein